MKTTLTPLARQRTRCNIHLRSIDQTTKETQLTSAVGRKKKKRRRAKVTVGCLTRLAISAECNHCISNLNDDRRVRARQVERDLLWSLDETVETRTSSLDGATGRFVSSSVNSSSSSEIGAGDGARGWRMSTREVFGVASSQDASRIVESMLSASGWGESCCWVWSSCW